MANILDQFGRPVLSAQQHAKRETGRRLEARYDAAQTTRENERHWANADHLSPAAAANPEVRRKLRSRARYEINENNSFAKGVVLTIAKDTVRTGPRVQFSTGRKNVDEFLEREVNRWIRAVHLARRLRTARLSKAVDGEVFFLAKTNPRLPTLVKLDFDLLEGDQVATPQLSLDPQAIDGIVFDSAGNPAEYHVLRDHPGTDRPIFGGVFKFHRVSAEQVVHWFREDRPNQKRGIPEVTPALPLFALWRRFLLATVNAAETAAEFAAVLQTDGAAVDPAEVEPMDAIELERNAALTLPAGWKLGQIRAEHPQSTIEMFRNLIVSEVARCLLVDFAKATLDTRGFTFASAKVGRDDYIESVETERADIGTEILDRLLFWWLDEAALIPDYLPRGLGPFVDLDHSWHWDGFREADPNKQANADRTLWDIGLLSDAEYLQRRGVDPDQHYRRMRDQQRRRQQLGLPLPGEKDREPVPADDEDGEESRAQAAAGALLEADSVPADVEFVAAPVELAAAGPDSEGQLRRFTMVAYSGGVMQPRGFPGNVVVDLRGLTVAEGPRPILLGHDPRQIVGHTTKVAVTGQITAAGVISGAGAAAQEVLAAAANGFPWRASIGARATRVQRVEAGEQVEVNGRMFRGPLDVVRQARLQEISFLALPGDERTSATVEATIERTPIMDFNAWLEASGYQRDDLSAAQLQSLHAIYARQRDQIEAGTALARRLESAIEAATNDDHTRASVVANMSRAANLEAGTVDQFLNGSADCPSREQLAAFARTLNVGVDSLLEAAREDGVEIEAGRSGRTGDNNPGNGGGGTRQTPSGQTFAAQQAAETRRIAAIRNLCAGAHAELEAQAIEENWQPQQVELEILRASRPAARTPQNDPAAGGWSAAAFEAALCLSVGIPAEIAGSPVNRLLATMDLDSVERRRTRREELDEREVDRAMTAEYRGLSLHALMDAVIEASGQHYRGARNTNAFVRAALEAERDLTASSSGFTTLSLTNVLNNVANKQLLSSYEAQRITWPEFCAVRSNTNFKAHERHRLDSTGGYQKVGPDGELKHIGLGDAKFSTTLETHGAMIALTRKMMIDDDLDAFGQIPMLLGRLAALKPEEEVYKLLLSNPSSFFSAGNGNLLTGAGSALAIASLSNGIEKFRNQVDSNGKPILVEPEILLVPTTLAVEADDLRQNTQVAVRLDTNDARQVVRNPHANRFRNVTSPYINNTAITDVAGAAISGQSDTQWYLFADPMVRAAIAVAFLQGRRVPVIESADTDFNTLGIQWRSYHDFGVGMEDTVAAVKSAGA